MFKQQISLYLFGLLSLLTYSQNEDFISASTIPQELIDHANAVIRLDETKIEIPSINQLIHKYRRIVTVLNKKGDDDLDAYVYYDDGIKVKDLKAVVYDQFGNEEDKFKKSEFKDVAAVRRGTLYEDSRVKFLEYTPINYPYTVEFIYETETENTGWIPFWRPLEDYYLSTEKSTFEVVYDNSVGINLKEKNFSGFKIKGANDNGILTYSAENLKAIKPEDMSPSFREFAPILLVTPKNFYYEGYNGVIDNWDQLGKWINDNLLKGKDQISKSTEDKILHLVDGINDPIEKAKMIYRYVQDNTRYISVQVGIGGIQPISAFDVDNVKYGDCKGLTNYTKALLDIVGVKSYYTEVYASHDIHYSVEKDFASLFGQGNHIILNIPRNDQQPIWLECTSQRIPFGFLGDFTDDRDVFVITPQGGKIEHTPKYSVEQNVQNTTGQYTILDDGSIEAETEIVSTGLQYNDRFSIEKEDRRNQDIYYKNFWKTINNIEINTIDILNDKEHVVFTEKINFKAKNYTSTVGDKILFVPNAYNRYTDIPDRYRDRKLPLSINKGFVDNDEYVVNLPKGYKAEFIPKKISIENKFGKYIVEIEPLSENKLKYKRTLSILEGLFPKEDYSKYRDFLREVSKNDNAKIILTKKEI